MKKFAYLLSVAMLLCTTLNVSAITATPTKSTITVDGQSVMIDAYNIDGFNYFKLRDIAYVLRQTDKKFDIGYDLNTDTIFLTSGKTYTVVGGEMQKGGIVVSEATPTNQNIVKDGEMVSIEAYNIDGNNYSKLRDLGDKFDFDVKYDANTNNIEIETEVQTETPKSRVIYVDDAKPAVLPTPIPM